MMMATLASCGGTSDTGKKTDNGGTHESGTPAVPDNTKSIKNLDGLADDLTLDSDGKVVFEDQVELSVWCIIGDPDQKVYNDVVTRFNNEYQGLVHLNMKYIGHYDYYNNLENTYMSDFEEGFPDVCVMHNEKTAEYANKGYLLPLDDITAKTTVATDYSMVYENIDRVTKFDSRRYAVPMDAHGFVTSIRQDIIKKNELGFDGNTRYIPNSRQEYQELLEKLRSKADAGELWTRNINKGQDHSWKKATSSTFYPEFIQAQDPDGLSALYANGGSICNEAGDKIIFHENKGFETYVLDQVNRYNDRLMGESGTNAESFGSGNTVMFSEGPWWVSQQYTLQWNNTELKKAGEKGVTEEDAQDEVYSKPYIASRPTGWWTLDENKESENANKWYGNGHAISLTRHITSAQKAAAAMTFINWFTQGKDADTDTYNLAEWCNSGHIPAWKNVYDSSEYKDYLSKNMTLRALGDPADIIAMEGLAYETTCFNALTTSITLVQSQLKTKDGCDEAKAKELIKKAVDDGQAALEIASLL